MFFFSSIKLPRKLSVSSLFFTFVRIYVNKYEVNKIINKCIIRLLDVRVQLVKGLIRIDRKVNIAKIFC